MKLILTFVFLGVVVAGLLTESRCHACSVAYKDPVETWQIALDGPTSSKFLAELETECIARASRGMTADGAINVVCGNIELHFERKAE